jgi:hypothetical protein
VYMGAFNRLRVAVPDGELLVTSQNLDVRGVPRAVQGQRVALSWDEDSSRPLAETERPAPALAGANE